MRNEAVIERQVFQQDGATAHTGHGNLILLQELFPGRLISRGSDFPYPAPSSDLSLCDAFLWGILKEQCFIPAPRTLDALRENIERVMHNLTREQCDAMLTRMVERMEEVIANDERHVEYFVNSGGGGGGGDGGGGGGRSSSSSSSSSSSITGSGDGGNSSSGSFLTYWFLRRFINW
ncbi:hypothetical protein ANN_04647 [Periplaneta americana]|uniref:Tc1-like transposase DDE domain-containing protein n=1 Tax=Periplaneta americana TaxID=6978 RepID=A0ABQ8TAL0_PERAM|nr:hypothetical protein ANN_04647 [Periplaneta americana]